MWAFFAVNPPSRLYSCTSVSRLFGWQSESLKKHSKRATEYRPFTFRIHSLHVFKKTITKNTRNLSDSMQLNLHYTFHSNLVPIPLKNTKSQHTKSFFVNLHQGKIHGCVTGTVFHQISVNLTWNITLLAFRSLEWILKTGKSWTVYSEFAKDDCFLHYSNSEKVRNSISEALV